MDSGDGRIERELHPLVNEAERSEVDGRGNWEVRVWTSDIRGAGTDANVTLQVSTIVHYKTIHTSTFTDRNQPMQKQYK